jgi:hypothetical protein
MEEKKQIDNCEIEVREIEGKRFFKCKNLKRDPTAQEIVDEVSKKSKIIYNID